MARQAKAPRHGGSERQVNGTTGNAAQPDGPSSPQPAKGDGDTAAADGSGVNGKHGSTAAIGTHVAPYLPNGNVVGGSGRAQQHVNGTSGVPVKQNAASSGSRSQVAGQLHEHVRQQLQAAPFPDQRRGTSHDPPTDKMSGQHAVSDIRFSGNANGAERQADPLSMADAQQNGHAKPRVMVIDPPRAAGHTAHAGGGNQQRRQQPPIMQFGTFTDDRPARSGPATPPQPVTRAGHAFNQSVAAALGLGAANPSAAVSPATGLGPANDGGKCQQHPAVAAAPAAMSSSAAPVADGSAGIVVSDTDQRQTVDRPQQGARRGRGGSAHHGGRGPHRGRHSPVHSKPERDGRVLEVVR